MVIRVTRFVLYALLFACSTVLLGLTAYRVHYTKSLSNGDILTTRSHFYDPRIVALMVASIVSLVFSLVMLGLLVGSVDFLVGEHLCLWILWIFFLITAALVTDQFSNLKYCRSHNKVCRILETIKAFGWICWGFLSILIIVSLINFWMGNRGNRNTRGAVATHPDTRQAATTGTTVHDHPRTTQGVPTAHGASTKSNSQHPATTPAAPGGGADPPRLV